MKSKISKTAIKLFMNFGKMLIANFFLSKDKLLMIFLI